MKKKLKENEVMYIEGKENDAKYKHLVNDSELLRIIEAIDPVHREQLKQKEEERQKKRKKNQGREDKVYIEGLISVRVRYNTPMYEDVKNADGVLILKHWKWNKYHEDGREKKVLEPALDDSGKQIEERFKRCIVGSGHNRGKKALFIREDLYDKVNKILLGGIDEYRESNGYPHYSKGYAKWSSYYGLASTDSKVVAYLPKIVVVKDFGRKVEDTFDIVEQTKTINPEWKTGQSTKNKYKKEYQVHNNEKKECEILPFDGAGLVSVECAKRWKDELHLLHLPAAFQIRAIAGIKGNLYTFDIKSFAEENGWVITDNKGRKHDYREEPIDIILTESQTKFLPLYGNDIELWRKVFDKPVEFEDGTSYKRTFNISEYSEAADELKHKMYTAYQHWQTISNKDEEIQKVIKPTVEMIKKVSSDMNEFMRYRSCTDEKEKCYKEEWKRLPAYYRAAYYATEENQKVIFADRFFQNKVTEDIEGMKNRALSGKLYIRGNYQVLTPDIYGLAQFAFGKRGKEVTGLLKDSQIYSNWWLEQGKKNDTELALIRNPHIYMEARVAKLVKGNQQMEKWYCYQTTGIITDSHSTIPLALGTADFDGDHIATTDCKEYIDAVNRARTDRKGNTIDWYCNDQTGGGQISSSETDISDVKRLMDFDILAYRNNIGAVIDKVTMLWGTTIEKDDENNIFVSDYIKIMDIIGQLTIDAAKTGEFEAIYEPITKFIKNKNIKKPYFMKYLQKNKKKRKQEQMAQDNAKFFFEDDETIVGNQAKFSDDNTNINRLCHKLEDEIEQIGHPFNNLDFSLDDFLNIFCTEKPNTTSALFIKVRDTLQNLSKQHGELYYCFCDAFSDEEREEKESHYKYFYLYAKEELLNLGRLSYEKSLNKIVNCVVYLAYADAQEDDNAKNILWNCFGEELVKRAKQDYRDKELLFDGLSGKRQKVQESRKQKLKKCSGDREVCIKEFEDKNEEYLPIIVNEDNIEAIRGLFDKGVTKHRDELIKLYAVLLVLSKRYECVRKYKSKKEESKEDTKYIVRSLKIRSSSNNGLNYSSLAKLCGFSDYQRKNIKERLKELQEIDAITILSKDLSDLNIRVKYEPVQQTENGYDMRSLVDKKDYKLACEQILKLVEGI